MTITRALIVAHPFPPTAGGGVQRTSKLVKYLPSHGVQPTVLTTPADFYPKLFGVRDDTLLDELPRELPIVRVPTLESLPDPPGMSRVISAVLAPERSRLWNVTALPVAVGLVKSRKIDLIYGTGGPYSVFLLARSAALLARVPYVLDMRDSWMLWERRKKGNALMERRLLRMEREVLLGAARVVFVTRPMEEMYLAAYPGLVGRTRVIPNGFDDHDFREMRNPLPLLGPADPVFFAYTGTINAYVRPESFLEGFRIARARDAAFASRARVRFLGRAATRAVEVSFREAISARELDSVCELAGYKTHAEAVLVQRTSDVLVLITAGIADAQHGKTPEYLAAERPVLALVPEGTPAELMLRGARWREVAPPDEPGAIAGALLALFRAADARRPGAMLPASRAELAGATRRVIAGEMAAVFRDALRSRAQRA